MSAFDPPPPIDPSYSSPSVSSMPNRDELDAVNEYVKLAESQSHLVETLSFRFP